MPIVPAPVFIVYTNLASSLTAMSRLLEPVGSEATTVPGSAVTVPEPPMAKPEIEELTVLEVNANCPLGVSAI
jgi:hypothetical protein